MKSSESVHGFRKYRCRDENLAEVDTVDADRNCNNKSLTFQRTRVSASTFLNVCGFASRIAFAKSPTVSLFPMLTGKDLWEMSRTQQKSLNWSGIVLDEVKPGILRLDSVFKGGLRLRLDSFGAAKFCSISLGEQR